MSTVDNNNKIPSQIPGGGGDGSGSTGQLTKTIGNLLTEMLGVKGKGSVEKSGVGEVKGHDTETFIKFNTDGSLKVSVDFADPKLRKANDPLIELFISSLVLETIDGSKDQHKDLVMSLLDGLNGVKGGLNIAPPPGNAGKSETCAFLGGLVMVALGDILALFAKLESFIKKMSSVLFLSSQACMKDLAECIAKNTEDKARSQAEAKILQAVVTAVSTGVQVGCTAKAWGGLSKTTMEKDALGKITHVSDPLASSKATLLGQYGSAASSIGQATGNLIEARSILEVGQLEASNIRMQFMQEQMGKMQDTYSKMGNDADQKIGEIWDLLKNMFSNLFQAFRSLTGK